MKNYLNFENEIKNLETELEKLKANLEKEVKDDNFEMTFGGETLKGSAVCIIILHLYFL